MPNASTIVSKEIRCVAIANVSLLRRGVARKFPSVPYGTALERCVSYNNNSNGFK